MENKKSLEKMLKSIERFTEILARVWIISWFLAIWSPWFKWELFFTGLFTLALFYGANEKEKDMRDEIEQKECKNNKR